MQTFNSPLKGHLLQVVPRPNDSALSRIATELKQEFGTVIQEPFPASWAVLLHRLEASHSLPQTKAEQSLKLLSQPSDLPLATLSYS
jgi:hypothetical protein